MPNYPGLGKPCNQCGLCCLAEQCPVSLAFFGKYDRCPALNKTDAGYSCDIIAHPMQYAADPRFANTKLFPPIVGAEFPEVWQAHFQWLFGSGICDSAIEDDELVELENLAEN